VLVTHIVQMTQDLECSLVLGVVITQDLENVLVFQNTLGPFVDHCTMHHIYGIVLSNFRRSRVKRVVMTQDVLVLVLVTHIV
jgi:hypothetical protein